MSFPFSGGPGVRESSGKKTQKKKKKKKTENPKKISYISLYFGKRKPQKISYILGNNFPSSKTALKKMSYTGNGVF